MPILFKEDRQELNKKQIVIPKEIKKDLQKRRTMYQGYESNPGFKRLKKYTEKDPYNDRSKGKKQSGKDVKTISFSDAKRTLSDMSNTINKDSLEYKLNGGEQMQNFLSNAIKRARGVGQVKKVKPVPQLSKALPKVETPSSKDIELPKGTVKLSENAVQEDPDFFECHVDLNDGKGEQLLGLSFYDKNAVPFIFEPDFSNIYVGEKGSIHSDIQNNGESISDEFYYGYGGTEALNSMREEYPQGRIWNVNGTLFLSVWDERLFAGKWNRAMNMLDRELKDIGFIDNFQTVYDAYFDDGGLNPGTVDEFLEYMNKKIQSYEKGDNEENEPQESVLNFDLAKIHTLSPEEKAKTPQMQGALKTKYDKLAKKLGKETPDNPNGNSRSVPEAEYNFYKRYGMGENKKSKKVYLSETQLKALKEYGII